MAKTALITGASSGIGEEFAKIFAREKYHLVLVARSEDKLIKLANDLQSKYGVVVQVIAKDLAKPTAPQELFVELKNTQIDTLVNNAGYATYGEFVDIDLQTELNEMQLNMVTLTHLTKLFLPAMIQKGFGQILNVASTAAFQPGPLMAVYYATKAYVLSFSEAIAKELEGTGVTVSALCPGPTKSGFQERADMQDARLVQSGLMSAQKVAERGYKGLIKGERVVIPGFQNKLGALAVRFSPRNMATNVVMNMQKRVEH